MFRFPAKLPALFAALALVSIVLSACSISSATPTPSLAELQAAALTAAAQTLTAQAPPPTPVPPTPTPLPPILTVEPPLVFTPPPAPPTLPPTAAPKAAEEDAPKEQDCSKMVITAATEGPRAPVQVVNRKGSLITLSYFLEPSPYGQCGSGSLMLGGEAKTLNLPVGCYWLYAWVNHNGKEQSFEGYGCNKKSGSIWSVFPDRIEAIQNDW